MIFPWVEAKTLVKKTKMAGLIPANLAKRILEEIDAEGKHPSYHFCSSVNYFNFTISFSLCLAYIIPLLFEKAGGIFPKFIDLVEFCPIFTVATHYNLTDPIFFEPPFFPFIASRQGLANIRQRTCGGL